MLARKHYLWLLAGACLVGLIVNITVQRFREGQSGELGQCPPCQTKQSDSPPLPEPNCPPSQPQKPTCLTPPACPPQLSPKAAAPTSTLQRLSVPSFDFYDDSRENQTRIEQFGFIVMCSRLFPDRLAGMLATWMSHFKPNTRQNVLFFVDKRDALLSMVRRTFQAAPSLRSRFSKSSDWVWYESRVIEYDDKKGRTLSARVPHALQTAYQNFSSSVKWFMKLDDDTFVHLFRLANLAEWDTIDPNTEYGYFGHRQEPKSVPFSYNWPDGPMSFCDGGGGYVLSRHLLRTLVERGLFESCAKVLPEAVPEDMATAACAAKVMITAPSMQPPISPPETPPLSSADTPPSPDFIATANATLSAPLPPTAPPERPAIQLCTHINSFNRMWGYLNIPPGLGGWAVTAHEVRQIDTALLAYERFYLNLYIEAF